MILLTLLKWVIRVVWWIIKGFFIWLILCVAILVIIRLVNGLLCLIATKYPNGRCAKCFDKISEFFEACQERQKAERKEKAERRRKIIKGVIRVVKIFKFFS